MLEKIVKIFSDKFWLALQEGIKEKVNFRPLLLTSIESFFYDRIDEINGWENKVLMNRFEYFTYKHLAPRFFKLRQARVDKKVCAEFDKRLRAIDSLKIHNPHEKAKISYEDAVRCYLEDSQATHDTLKKLLNLDEIVFNGSTEKVVEELRTFLRHQKEFGSPYWRALVKNEYESFDKAVKLDNNSFKGKEIIVSRRFKKKRNELREKFKDVFYSLFSTEVLYIKSVSDDLDYAFARAINTLPYGGKISSDTKFRDMFSPESIQFLTESFVRGVGEIFYALKMGSVSFWRDMAIKSNLPIVGEKWKKSLKNVLGYSELPDFEQFVVSFHQEKMKLYDNLRDIYGDLLPKRFNTLSFAEQKEFYRKRMKKIHTLGVPSYYSNGTPFMSSIDDDSFRQRVNESYFVDRMENDEEYSCENRPILASDVEKYIFSGDTPVSRYLRRMDVVNMNNSGLGNLIYKLGAKALLFKDLFNLANPLSKGFGVINPEERVDIFKDPNKHGVYSEENFSTLKGIFTNSGNGVKKTRGVGVYELER